MRSKFMFATLILISTWASRSASAQSQEVLDLEVGGFDGSQPDPSTNPSDSYMAGYMKVTGKPGLWVYPMFQASIGMPTSGTTAARDALILEFPYLADLPNQTLDALFGEVPFLIDSDFPVLVSADEVESTMLRVLDPLTDVTAKFRMQPIVPNSSPSSSSTGTNYSLTWDTEPSMWDTYVETSTRGHWRALRYNDRGHDNWGTIAVNFDEVLQETIRVQIARANPGWNGDQVQDEFERFMDDAYDGSKSGYDVASETWGVRLIIQFFAIRATSGERTAADIVATGLKGIDNTNDEILEVNETALVYPEVILSDTAEIVFQTDPSTGGSSTWPTPKNADAAPIAEVGNFVTINVACLTSLHKVIWVNEDEQFKSAALIFAAPGCWKFQIPATTPTGDYDIVRFKAPNGQLQTPLAYPLEFHVTQ